LQITLSLEPRFKRSITYDYRNDSTFQDDFAAHAASHEFADITWYPSQHTAVYRIDDRAPLDAPGDGVNDFIGFQATPIAVTAGLRAVETSLERSKNVRGKCVTAAAEGAAKRLVGSGLKNNGLLFTGYPVVGYQGKMQTSGSCARSSAADLLSACGWDPRFHWFHGLFFYESTAIFSPPARFRDFILDVKRLRDLAGADSLCGVDVYNGLLVRFVKASAAHLGQPEDSVVVDFNYYRASDPAAPRLSEDVWEEVEQLAFVKHGARPHWAKNRLVAFAGVRGKYPRWAQFAAAKRQLDPRGLFDSPWSDEVVGGVEVDKGDGCALDGRCVCSEDMHCSPRQGYYCRPGLVFTDARVCRYTPCRRTSDSESPKSACSYTSSS
jgi:FAD-dependent oxidoreductase